MKKKFLKIVLGLFIFLGINNYGFASVPEVHIDNYVDYDLSTITLLNNGYSQSYNAGELQKFYILDNSSNNYRYLIMKQANGHSLYCALKNTGVGKCESSSSGDFNSTFHIDLINDKVCLDPYEDTGRYIEFTTTNAHSTNGSCPSDYVDILQDGEYVVNKVLYGGQPTIGEIVEPGSFETLPNGATGYGIRDIQFNGNGYIKIIIEEKENPNNFVYRNIPYDLNYPISYVVTDNALAYQNGPEDSGYTTVDLMGFTFKKGTEYNTSYSFIPTTKDDNTPLHGPTHIYQTQEVLYTIPTDYNEIPTQENCPENTTLKKISQYNPSTGVNEYLRVCLYPGNTETVTVTETTLSGSTIENNVTVNNEPVNNITNDININLVDSGSLDIPDDDEYKKNQTLSGYLNNFQDKFGNTFDNIGDKINISGIEEKASTVIADINQRLELNENKSCEMFNSDGSFKSYGTLDFSFNFNILQGNDFDYILFIPQKLINFITNPINNLLSITSVFETFEDGQEICYLGSIEKVEYQKFFKELNKGIRISNMSNQDLVIIGKETFFDYMILIVFGIILTFGVVTVFSRLY